MLISREVEDLASSPFPQKEMPSHLKKNGKVIETEHNVENQKTHRTLFLFKYFTRTIAKEQGALKLLRNLGEGGPGTKSPIELL